jgi:hypothetical protein
MPLQDLIERKLLRKVELCIPIAAGELLHGGARASRFTACAGAKT